MRLKELVSGAISRFQSFQARREITDSRQLLVTTIQRGIISEGAIDIFIRHKSVLAVIDLSKQQDAVIDQLRDQNPRLSEQDLKKMVTAHPQFIELDTRKTELTNSFSIAQLGAWLKLEIERDEARLKTHEL